MDEEERSAALEALKNSDLIYEIDDRPVGVIVLNAILNFIQNVANLSLAITVVWAVFFSGWPWSWLIVTTCVSNALSLYIKLIEDPE